MFLWLSRGDLKGETKWNNSSTRSGITNKITGNKNIRDRNR
jgi:hypothetical protein